VTKRNAGVDFGLSSIKIYFKNTSGEEIFLSSNEVSRKSLVSVLAHSGVTDIFVAGNGPMDGFERFSTHRLIGDQLAIEKITQARGAILLSERDGKTRLSGVRRMIVSIGTGTSYIVEDTECEQYFIPIGNANGAGTIDGKLASFGLSSGAAIDGLFAEGFETFDLTMGETIPSTRGTKLEFYTASHFAKAARNPPQDQQRCDKLAAGSAVNELVVSVARDLLIFDRVPDWSGTEDVIVVGTLPSRSKTVRSLLEFALRMVGKNPIFPTHGEYALAIGAYHDLENNS
jgi:hypothetical protein